MKRWRFVIVLVAAWGFGLSASAQVRTPDNCPADAQALPLTALFGRWEARFDGIPGMATVELARHPEYAGVRGTIRRDEGGTAELAGDIDDEGSLVIDESKDGRAISAIWSGKLQQGSCGQVFEGTWRRAADEFTTRFTLRKPPAGGIQGKTQQ